jgi:hypothetical protein
MSSSSSSSFSSSSSSSVSAEEHRERQLAKFENAAQEVLGSADDDDEDNNSASSSRQHDAHRYANGLCRALVFRVRNTPYYFAKGIEDLSNRDVVLTKIHLEKIAARMYIEYPGEANFTRSGGEAMSVEYLMQSMVQKLTVVDFEGIPGLAKKDQAAFARAATCDASWQTLFLFDSSYCQHSKRPTPTSERGTTLATALVNSSNDGRTSASGVLSLLAQCQWYLQNRLIPSLPHLVETPDKIPMETVVWFKKLVLDEVAPAVWRMFVAARRTVFQQYAFARARVQLRKEDDNIPFSIQALYGRIRGIPNSHMKKFLVRLMDLWLQARKEFIRIHSDYSVSDRLFYQFPLLPKDWIKNWSRQTSIVHDRVPLFVALVKMCLLPVDHVDVLVEAGVQLPEVAKVVQEYGLEVPVGELGYYGLLLRLGGRSYSGQTMIWPDLEIDSVMTPWRRWVTDLGAAIQAIEDKYKAFEDDPENAAMSNADKAKKRRHMFLFTPYNMS